MGVVARRQTHEIYKYLLQSSRNRTIRTYLSQQYFYLSATNPAQQPDLLASSLQTSLSTTIYTYKLS